MRNTIKKKNKNSSDLVQLVQILDGLQKQRITLDDALEFICDVCQAKRVLLVLLSPLDGDLYIEAAAGLSSEQKMQGHYVVGEGIVGKVIQSGEPMFIHDVMQNPRFLNRTNAREAREKISFLCVPIIIQEQVIGALGMDTLTEDLLNNPQNSEHLERLLSVIASSFTPYIQRYQKTMENRAGAKEGTEQKKNLVKKSLQGSDIDISINTCNELKTSVSKIQGTSKKNLVKNSMEASSFLRSSHRLVGMSESIQLIYRRIDQVAPTSTTVMLRGESGTGKELVARAIHEKSLRYDKPFITINCAALPESLVESELFGHEKGAFTSAMQSRKGRFEIADTGTLFLDEVGELSLATQARLLRVLQERCFERVGSVQSIHVDVRIITATNRPLETMVEEGTFRKDLYYRLNVFSLELPPLRERKSDILLLAEHFLSAFALVNNREKPKLSQAVCEMLERYSWQGNIRELENIMERCMILLGNGRYILPQHLPSHLHSSLCTQCGANYNNVNTPNYMTDSMLDSMSRQKKQNLSLVDKALARISGNFAQESDENFSAVMTSHSSGENAPDAPNAPNAYDASNPLPNALRRGSLPERIEALERNAILEALDEFNGHMGAAASYLGLTERVMGQRMKKYSISYKDFRK